jgi:hypothetical protein
MRENWSIYVLSDKQLRQIKFFHPVPRANNGRRADTGTTAGMQKVGSPAEPLTRSALQSDS